MELPRGLSWLKIFLKFSFVLLALNVMSFALTIIYGADITIATISLVIAAVISLSCFSLIRIKGKMR